MAGATDRKCVELRRGRVYDVSGVETLAVVEATIRGIRVIYTGEFDTAAENGVKSERHTEPGT